MTLNSLKDPNVLWRVGVFMLLVFNLYLNSKYASKEEIKEIGVNIVEIRDAQKEMQFDTKMLSEQSTNRSALLVQHDRDIRDLDKRTTIIETKVK